MNYQILSNLQFEALIKIFFHSFQIDLWDTSCEKLPFASVGIARLVLIIRKLQTVMFIKIGVTR